MSNSPNEESSSAPLEHIHARELPGGRKYAQSIITMMNFDLKSLRVGAASGARIFRSMAPAHLSLTARQRRQLYEDVVLMRKGDKEAEFRVRSLLAQSYLENWKSAAARTEKQAEPVRLARPPRLAFGALARLILKPAAYKRYVEPAIADMHEEYFACLARRDERGAKIAVIKGNLYAVPGWLWALLAQLVLKLIGLIRA